MPRSEGIFLIWSRFTQGSALKPRPAREAPPRPAVPRTPGSRPAVKRPVAAPVKPELKRPYRESPPAPAPKKAAPLRAPPPPAPPQPGPDGCYRLDALTQQVLEQELQLAMIKVWDDLPENPETDAEKLVVDMLRNETGKEIRNILGLNVTKRLLNVFNPLNVKVHFSTKPERHYLRLFLKRYHFVGFKRIARVENTFAAQVRAVADLDRLTREREIHAGAAKITITPYYRFGQCPSNLKTMYSVSNAIKTETKGSVEKEDHSKATSSKKSRKAATPTDGKEGKFEVKPKTDTTINKPTTPNVPKAEIQKTNVNNSTAKLAKTNTPAPKVENKPEQVKSQPKVEPAKAQVNKTEPVKPQPKVTPTKPIADKPAVKASPKTKPAAAQATVAQPKVVQPKPQEENKPQAKQSPAKPPAKVEPQKPQVANKTEPPKPQPKATPPKPQPANKTEAKLQPAAVPPRTQVANKNITANPTAPSKPQVIKTAATPQAKEPAKPQTASKPQAKPQPKAAQTRSQNANKTNPSKPATVTKPKAAAVNNAKRVAPKAPPKKIASRNKSTRRSYEDDNEELDDETILALMSGGIVLDECLGSDGE